MTPAKSLPRIRVATLVFAIGFVIVSARLASFGFGSNTGGQGPGPNELSSAVHRPDIVDRRGRILAKDIRSAGLYADPKQIVDLDETVEQLAGVLPGIDAVALRRRLKSERRFEWIKRELTPGQQADVHELGLPGLAFVDEPHRVYPAGSTAAHILGFVDVDNRGLAGIEKHIDGWPRVRRARGQAESEMAPVQLSIDLGAQHALREELADAQRRYEAKAAAGVVMNIHSGEVVAISSLPDYDPNRRDQARETNRFNRLTGGVFELGSIFKLFTTAAVLDLGVASMEDGYDATNPIQVASFKITDFHPKRRWLSVPEIFIYSSNIGAAKMALHIGPERHKSFLQRLGLFEPLSTEIGTTAAPILPTRWRRINSMTISFGHGVSVTPLNMARSAAAVFNGGFVVSPTFLRRTPEESRVLAHRAMKQKTSEQMRYLMRLNVTDGTAKRANAEGYRVGGKTGTAEKVVNGSYDRSALLTSLLGAFPMDQPEFVILVILDEPQRVEETNGYATAGVNAAPTTRRIIERIGPILGVEPDLKPKPAFDAVHAATY